MEMSPAPSPNPPSPAQASLWPDPPSVAGPPVDSMAGGRQRGQGRIDEQGRIDDITDATRDFALQLPCTLLLVVRSPFRVKHHVVMQYMVAGLKYPLPTPLPPARPRQTPLDPPMDSM